MSRGKYKNKKNKRNSVSKGIAAAAAFMAASTLGAGNASNSELGSSIIQQNDGAAKLARYKNIDVENSEFVDPPLLTSEVQESQLWKSENRSESIYEEECESEFFESEASIKREIDNVQKELDEKKKELSKKLVEQCSYRVPELAFDKVESILNLPFHDFVAVAQVCETSKWRRNKFIEIIGKGQANEANEANEEEGKQKMLESLKNIKGKKEKLESILELREEELQHFVYLIKKAVHYRLILNKTFDDIDLLVNKAIKDGDDLFEKRGTDIEVYSLKSTIDSSRGELFGKIIDYKKNGPDIDVLPYLKEMFVQLIKFGEYLSVRSCWFSKINSIGRGKESRDKEFAKNCEKHRKNIANLTRDIIPCMWRLIKICGVNGYSKDDEEEVNFLRNLYSSRTEGLTKEFNGMNNRVNIDIDYLLKPIVKKAST